MFDIEHRLARLDRLARIDVNGDHDAVLVVRRLTLEEYLADHRHRLFPQNQGDNLDEASQGRQHFRFEGRN